MEDRVFLDTNILLSFYEISKENIKILKEAFALVDHKELVFVTTDQVEDEFYRRRNGVIEKSLSSLQELRMPEAPTMAKDSDLNEAYEETRKALKSAHNKLLEQTREHAVKNELSADELIADYFEQAKRISVTSEIIERARLRAELGNPPGKKGSLGDAINWEAILSLPEKRSMTIVSDDIDYRDKLLHGAVNDFLATEWIDNHEGEIKLFRSFSDYLGKAFPDLEIALFEATDEKIEELNTSPNFHTTHNVIADLSTVTQFTAKQAECLVAALAENTQVNWIFADNDVRSFYETLYENCGDKLDALKRDYLERMLNHDGTGAWPELIPF